MAAKINSKKRKQIKEILSKGHKKYHCIFCKRVFLVTDLTIEHIIPKKDGGSNEITNLVLSCKICNQHRDRADFCKYVIWMNNRIIGKPCGTKSGGNGNRFYKKRRK